MALKKDFKVGDLVWAKMKGFPFWPGEIIQPPENKPHLKTKKKHYCVNFFGSNNYACIHEENIFLHDKKSIERFVSGAKKSRILQLAVEIIMSRDKNKGKQVGRPRTLFKSLGSKEKISTKHKAPFESRSLKKRKIPKEDTEKTSKNESKISLDLTSKSLLSTSLESDDLSPERPKGSSLFDFSPAEIKKIIREDYEYIIRNSPQNLQYKTLSSRTEDANLGSSHSPEVVTDDTKMVKERPPSPQLDFKSVNEALIAKNIQPSNQKIGFLGLGKMGQGIVKNLLQSGHFVTVWNRTIEKCDPFTEIGANIAASPADVVTDSDIIFCCVSNADTAKGLIFGSNGVVKGLEKSSGNKSYVEMTSIEPHLSKIIADEVTNNGGRYLEVSLIGTRQESFEGSLLILAAGDETLFADCRSCFDAMGRDALFVGSSLGASIKLNTVYNTFLGTIYGALAETLNLADRVGLDQKLLLQVLQLGLMSSKGIADKGHTMISQEYTSNIPLNYMQQSMELGLTMGLKAAQPTLVLSAANQMYEYAQRLGYSDHDVSAVYEGVRK